MAKQYWTVVGKGFCRIVRTGGALPSDVLCDGTESTLRDLCRHLNELTPRILDIMSKKEE